ncbi:DNA alkylation repair protein [Desulfovibrio sp. JC010]|uniref:DNA alkylation repair protein n=1 Tax=Desulfovibrio sp. JC010 TaxID=2593641 RepID=UPI0013D20F2C|nr:DNA alkylation repair protein [Desulfovibrio sp. JC010]NDV27949.1 DNA alkylation repair protein [Desulfovibrio sp. JC010]
MSSNIRRNIQLLPTIRHSLQAVADPERAPAMQKYMKSEMEFYGIRTPVYRKICKQIFKKYEPWDFDKWQAAVLELWRDAEFREERYCAIELIILKSCNKHHVWKALPMLEEIITTGAWWDYCDYLAKPLGNILRAEPERMRALMLRWSTDDNMWKRRSSILCQLRFKEDLDFEFLMQCIEPNIDSKEFFLRKAIGWALRDYAWTHPQIVNDYIDANAERLSGLSRREALKNMHKLL